MSEQKKVVRNLLFALAAIAAVCVVVIVIFAMNPVKEEQESSHEDTAPLLSFDKQDFSAAYVHAPGGDYTISKAGGAKPAVAELGSLTQDEVALDQFVQDVSSITANSTVTQSAGDMAQYGLDNPMYVRVELSNGTKHTLNIGGEAPLGGTYVSLDDSKAVYIIESGTDNLIKDKESYVSLDLIANPNTTDEDGNVTVINPYGLKLSGAVRDGQQIEISKTQTNHLTTGEYVLPNFLDLPADSVLVSDIMAKIAPFSAGRAVAALPDDQTLARYGLDEPRSVITFMIEGTAHTISLGDKQNDEYFVMVDDIECVFAVHGEYVPWAEIGLVELLSQPIFDPGVTEITEMELEYGSKLHKFSVKSELYGSDYALSEVKLNNKSFDIDSFKDIYAQFTDCNMILDRLPDTAKMGELVLSAYVYHGEQSLSKFVFYAYDESSYALVFNGEVGLIVDCSAVDSFIDKLNGLD